MTPIAGRPIEILLVEDNRGDVRLIQEVFRTGKVSNRLHVAVDFAKLLHVVHSIESFWLTMATLPAETTT